MAHFAKLGKGNIIEKVVVVHNNHAATEADGINFLKKLYNNTRDIWVQTSYNTRGGKYYNSDGTEHSDQSLAFRKNFAWVGGKYDYEAEAFIPPQPFSSWTLNTTTYLWEAPVAKPNDGSIYYWDENKLNWVART